MERLKKTNQTMLLVVGFLTAIIPAFTFTEKLYNGSNLVFYSTLISALAGVIVFLILGSKFADKYAVRYVLVVVYGLTYAFWYFFRSYYYFCMLLHSLFRRGSIPMIKNLQPWH